MLRFIVLDDIARLATDAAGAAQGVRREVETIVKTQIERLLRELDVVPREEFEAVREMALLAREAGKTICPSEAARALGLADEIGTLEAGKRCDLAIWEIERPAELAYRMGFNPLHARILGGEFA